MLGGMNPKQVQSAMKKMGIAQTPIPATQVIIRQKEGEIVIDNPEVLKISMMNQISFQISGTIHENKGVSSPPNENDIQTVMEQANVDRETARRALEITKGDIAQAILGLCEEDEA